MGEFRYKGGSQDCDLSRFQSCGDGPVRSRANTFQTYRSPTILIFSDQTLHVAVQFACLLQRDEVLSTPFTDQRLGDSGFAVMAMLVTQFRQPQRITLAARIA